MTNVPFQGLGNHSGFQIIKFDRIYFGLIFQKINNNTWQKLAKDLLVVICRKFTQMFFIDRRRNKVQEIL